MSNRFEDLERIVKQYEGLHDCTCIPISAKGPSLPSLPFPFLLTFKCALTRVEKINLEVLVQAMAGIAKSLQWKKEKKLSCGSEKDQLSPARFDDKRDVGTRRCGAVFISGSGSIVNIWRSRKEGCILFVVVKHGNVCAPSISSSINL